MIWLCFVWGTLPMMLMACSWALYSAINSGGFSGSYEMPGFKSGSTVCKAVWHLF